MYFSPVVKEGSITLRIPNGKHACIDSVKIVRNLRAFLFKFLNPVPLILFLLYKNISISRLQKELSWVNHLFPEFWNIKYSRMIVQPEDTIN